MPSKSQAQNRFMHAVAEGKVEGVKPSVGKKFVKADAGRKIGKLPQHAGKKAMSRTGRNKARHMAKRGMISERAMSRMMAE